MQEVYQVLQEGESVIDQPAARRLGEHLRYLRNQRDWSLEYVSRELDISFSRLRDIEMTKMSLPEPELMEAFARLYGTTQAELLSVAGYAVPTPAGAR
jgi:transcriptional regulator with XRE-family HTH domain